MIQRNENVTFLKDSQGTITNIYSYIRHCYFSDLRSIPSQISGPSLINLLRWRAGTDLHLAIPWMSENVKRTKSYPAHSASRFCTRTESSAIL